MEAYFALVGVSTKGPSGWVACLGADLADLLTCCRYRTLEERKAVRSANAIERRFREVRRRTRPLSVDLMVSRFQRTNVEPERERTNGDVASIRRCTEGAVPRVRRHL